MEAERGIAPDGGVWEKHRYGILFAGALVWLSLGVIGTETTRINIRFALMVEDMAKHGIGVFPTINGVPYADYFSPMTILSYLTSGGGRWLNNYTLALPTLLFSAGIIVMTVYLADRISRQAGNAAAAFSMLSFTALQIYTNFGIDVPVAAAALGTVCLFRSKIRWSRQYPLWIVLLVAAFAIRGPLGLVLTGAAAAGYLGGSRQWKLFLLYGTAGVIAAGTAAAGMYGCIMQTGGTDLWQVFLNWQIYSRLGNAHESAPWYYLTNGLASYAPVTYLAIAMLVLAWCGKNRKLADKLFRKETEGKGGADSAGELAGWCGWALLPILLMSIPTCKHLRYIIVTVPAFALIAAWGFEQRGRLKKSEEIDRILYRISRVALPLTEAGLAIAATVCLILTGHGELFVYAAAGIAILEAVRRKSKGQTGGTASLLCLSAAFTTAVVIVAVPFDALNENSRNFVREAERLRTSKNVYLLKMDIDHDDLKYVYHVPESKRGEIVYLLENRDDVQEHWKKMYPGLNDMEFLAEGKYAADDMFIIPEKVRAELSGYASARLGRTLRTIHCGRMGHKEYCAVTLEPVKKPE